MFKTSAFDIWRQEEENVKIITLIKELDDKLFGGVPVSSITELCGGPGVGKTQLCLQLCINVQFPKVTGGLGGKAYYIDTNQGFSPHRLKEIAEHMESRFQHTVEKLCSTSEIECNNFKVTDILQNISYVYCTNYRDLMATILNLRNVLKNDSKVKLIVIDSFSFVVRQLEDASLRTRIVYEILTDLQAIALDFNVAIIVTNELTTRCFNNNWFIAPALGDSYAHKTNTRLILSRDPNVDCHVVMIDKSVLCDKIALRFMIKPSGIRSVLNRST